MEERTYLEGNKEKIKQLSKLPENEELMMLNLLKYKKKVAGTDLSGEMAYKNYMRAARPFLKKAGAELVFYGRPVEILIGPEDESIWDDVLIVKYKNFASFISMVKAKDYPAHLRRQALRDSRLIYCKSHLSK